MTDVFGSALRHKTDVSDRFYTFDPNVLALLDVADPQELRLIDVVRGAMASADGRGGCAMMSLDDLPEAEIVEAQRLLASKSVVAIDGTPATNTIHMGSTTAACFAVTHCSGREGGEPAITVSHVVERRRWRGDEPPETLDELVAELSQSRDAEVSWTTTLREHLERSHALVECAGYPVRIIDGPLFTQNLLSQVEGRALLSQLVADPALHIGVIKDVGDAHGLTRLCAMALRPREVFVHPIRMLLDQRFSQQRKVAGFVEEIIGGAFVRGVYQPRRKAFAFECRADRVPLVLALLRESAGSALNQETPFLLNLADAFIRAQFNADENTRRFLVGVPGDYAHKIFPEREFR
jgi:hypothetical protein